MQVLDNNRTLDAKEWALTIFISSLPIIGVIMLLVWAFTEETNVHKKNWAKGTLILWIIGFIIAFAFLFLFGGVAILSQMFN
ncbi:hypothetical protein [Lutimonas zeaxanthinifaciens]|uniref:hypothetical protein n=1 Tax=Lutimonas zeaxanthinifaciens TaxID=3060215 RepID=UPI00265CEE70|nr:hypothetical protein [Lutimonas sp. YSD2104]WKK65303.1 hypothetical protein QZH61_12025 [Lutimonas sp. YSD2104]